MAFDPWTYDTDKDCYISASEKDKAAADYQSGKITMSNLMAVVNLWEWGTKNPACGTPPVFDPWAYDTDGDCYISAAEKDQATADWQSGKITMSDAMAVVNLWVVGTKNPACGVPPEIAAHIDFGVVWFYIDSEEHIVDDRYFPADLPLGTPIHCSVSFCNDSDVAVILRTKMEIIDPDGIVRASEHPGFLVSARWCSERYVPSDGTITLDKKGIWKLHAVITDIGLPIMP